jgi:asparagine synthase (glutamine-hydrolysing)
MSGIVGIYSPDGRPVQKTYLDAMVDIISHRGPDGAEVWHNGPVGLGHRMLWNTPESLAEKLPLANRTGDLVITADARIDNREELLSALDFSGRAAGEIADSELILAAYEKWSESCPAKLLGDFAFAIWDQRQQLLFCARDHMGVMPFYYHHSPGKAFIFASEVKAILTQPEVPRRLNETKVADFLVAEFEDKSITFFQDINRLPPGHTLTVDRSGIKLNSYWSLDPCRELRLSSNEEYAEAFRDIFTEAVRCRLRSAFPVGSNLSGGIDSSSIVCVARELLARNGAQPLHTFSLIFEDFPQSDERPFINAVLAPGGLKPHLLPGDRLNPFGDIEQKLWHTDEPLWLPDLSMDWESLQVVNRQGVRVVLDGMNGDVTVSWGFEYLIDLFCQGRVLSLLQEAVSGARRMDYGLVKLLKTFLLSPLTPEPMRRVWHSLKYGRGGPSLGIIHPDFARRIGLPKRRQALKPAPPRLARPSRLYHWQLITSGGEPAGLELFNMTAAAFAVEYRYPYYDRRLVEFCLALPPEQKVYQGWNRMIVRRGLAHVLPEKVRWRGGKGDLNPSVAHRLLALGGETIAEAIFHNPKVIEDYLDLKVLRQAYQRYLAQENFDDAFAMALAANLGIWLRLMNF